MRAKFENSSTRDLIVPASWMMVRAPSSMIVPVAGLGPLEVLDDPLRGELDGRQGVLDLVGDPLGDFLPGRDLLGLDELGQVVEDDDEPRELAVGLLERRQGQGEVGHLAVGGDRDLACRPACTCSSSPSRCSCRTSAYLAAPRMSRTLFPTTLPLGQAQHLPGRGVHGRDGALARPGR